MKNISGTMLMILLLLFVLAPVPPAFAEPQGGAVTSGSAVIDQASPGVTNILQSSSKVIIDWQRFGIDVNELVKFIQPNELAVALNRVTGVDPSVILGSLKANGRIFLVNPNGVVFGPTAQVDVGGLLATTLNISNEDFLNGSYHFTQDPGKAPGAVANQGRITATDGGFIILVAPLVNNQGTIIANLGNVSLGASSEAVVNFDGQSLVNFVVQQGAAPGNVLMESSACDDILRQVVNNTGLVNAGSIVEEDGKVVLVGAEGVLVNSGTIAVNGAADHDAGSITLNSTQATVAAPTSALEARGLGENSNGGFIEVSTFGRFHLDGTVRAGAENGADGAFLLDPYSLAVIDVTGSLDGSGNPVIAGATGNTVSDDYIEELLFGTDGTDGVDVILQTSGTTGDGKGEGDITVTTPIDYTGAAARTITLNAADDTILNAAIESTDGALSVNLHANGAYNQASGDGAVYISGAITTQGGSVAATGINFTSHLDGAITTSGGDVTIDNTGAVTIDAAVDTTGAPGGDVLVGGSGSTVTLSDDITTEAGAITVRHGAPLTLGGAASLDSGGADITFAGTVNGAYALSANAGAGNLTLNGAVGGTAALASLDAAGASITVRNVTTTGAQSYTGAVALGSGTTLRTTNSDVTVDGTVDGGYSLAIVAGTGDVAITDVVGGAQRPVSFTVTGNEITVESVATTGAQTYNGAVTLGDDATHQGTTMTYSDTVDGWWNLTVTGNAVFGGRVDIWRLWVTGATALNGGAVTTQDNQMYLGAATLGANTTLTGSEVRFGTTAGGAHTLAVDGDAVFDGAVDVAALLVTGESRINSGLVTTSGTQTYAGEVTLTMNTTLTGSTVALDGGAVGAYDLTVAGNMSTGGAVDVSNLLVTGDSVLGGGSVSAMTQSYAGALTLADDETINCLTVTFNGDVGGAHALDVQGNAVLNGGVSIADLSVSGETTIRGGAVTTSGDQYYQDVVTLANDAALTCATATFDGTVAGAYDLALDGDVVLNGEANIASLSVTGASELNGGSVTTSGAQTYTGAVTLGATTTLTGPTIRCDGTVDGAQDLVVDAGTGTATFNDAIGGLDALMTLDVTADQITIRSVTTSGQQTYNGAVRLGAAATHSGSTVTYNGTVSQARPLAVIGDAEFNGAVDIANLMVSGQTEINGGSVKTSGTQQYQDAVVLMSDTTITASTATFDGTLMNNIQENITIDGNAVFKGIVALNSLAVTGTSVVAGGGMYTTDAQTYAGGVTLGDNTTFQGATVTFSSTLNGASFGLFVDGDAVFGGAVSALDTLLVSGATTLSGGSIATYDTQRYMGDVTLGADAALEGTSITFNSQVSGARALAVTGDARFDALVDIGSLSISGESELAGAAVVTDGAQTYAGPVSILSDYMLRGSTMTFNETLAGAGPQTLDVDGNAVFGGEVSGLATLAVSGTTALNGGSVSTMGPQDYDGAVTLGADATLNAFDVTFGGAVNGAHNLTVSGMAEFDGAVTLAKLTVTGVTDIDGGSVTTTGLQQYNNVVNLGADTELTASTVTCGSAVLGAHDLAVTGDAVFMNHVGTASLSVSGTTALNGISITTTGAQTYTGAVTLGNNQTLQCSSATLGDVNGASNQLVVEGDAVFTGAAVDLSSLVVTGDASFNGGSVTSSFTQQFLSDVTVGADATLTGTTMRFYGAVDGAHALAVKGNAEFFDAVDVATLSVSGWTIIWGGSMTTTGTQTYTGAVSIGTITSLTASTATFASTVVGAPLDISGNAAFGGAVTVDELSVSGTTALDGGEITTIGAQLYTGAVTLGADATLTATDVTFGGAVGGARNLTVNGAATLGGAVTGLDSLSVTGTTDLNGGAVSTSGAQQYDGAVTLGDDTALASSGGDISFGDAVDAAAGDETLTVQASSGNVAFGGDVGTATPLASLDVSALSITFGGDVTTEGDQSYTSGTALALGGLTSNAGDVSATTTAGGLTVGDITADGAITLASAGSIDDDNAGGTNLTAQSLVLTASSGIGNGDALETEASRLDAKNTGSGNIEITNTGDLTIADLNDDGTALFTNSGDAIVTAASSITVGAPVATAGGDLTLSASENITQTKDGDIATAGGNYTATADDDLDGTGSYVIESIIGYAGDIATAGGNATITAADIAIDVSKVVKPAINAGTGIVTLTSHPGVAIDLGAALPGNMGLTAAELNTATAEVLRIGSFDCGDIVIREALAPRTASSLSLSSGGAISETGAGAISHARLALQADGAISLGSLTNRIGTLAVSDTGAASPVTIKNNTPLIVGAVDGVNGVSTNDGAITLSTVSTGAITINDTAASYDIDSGSADTVLVVNGAVMEEDSAAVRAGRLSITARESVTMNQENEVGTFAASILTPSKSVIFRNSGALTIGTVGGVKGVRTKGGAITLATTDGDLTVTNTTDANDINAETGILTLDAGGADSLLTLDAGAVVKCTGGASYTADSMTLIGSTNAGSKAVVSLAGSSGGREINLGGDTAGQLGIIDAELDTITAGSLRVGSNMSGTITVTGAIAPARSKTLSLNSGGNIVETTGTITTTSLTLEAAGDVTMEGNNEVTTLAGAAGTGKTFSYRDATAFAVGKVSGITGITADGGVVKLAGMDMSQTTGAGIVAGKLAIASTGKVTLGDTANNVGTLAATMSGTGKALTYRNAGALTIGTVAGQSGITNASSDVVLQVNGALTQSAAANVRASRLAIKSTGAVTLTNMDNDVNSLVASVAGAAFSYTDANALAISDVPIVMPDKMRVSGIQTASGNVSVTAGASGSPGTLTVGAVNAGTGSVTLTAFGNIVDGNANTKNITAGADSTLTSLTGTVGLGASSSGLGVSFSNAAASLYVNAGGKDPVTTTAVAIQNSAWTPLSHKLVYTVLAPSPYKVLLNKTQINP